MESSIYEIVTSCSSFGEKKKKKSQIPPQSDINITSYQTKKLKMKDKSRKAFDNTTCCNFFFFFLWLHLQHMEVPKLEVTLEL